MHHRSASLALSLLLVGCFETASDGREKSMLGEDDSGAASDDACATSPSSDPFTLVEVASANLGMTGVMVHAGRSADLDGDGAVTAADPMQIWVQDWGESIRTFNPDGTAAGSSLTGTSRTQGTMAEVDSTSPGMEFVASWTVRGDSNHHLGVFSPAGTGWQVNGAVDDAEPLFATDLEGDGDVELLDRSDVVDGATGAVVTSLAGLSARDEVHAIAADLDRDGIEEIVAVTADPPRANLHLADGSLVATCWSDLSADWTWVEVAIGNLDADADGEFVVATNGAIVLCDTDGSPLITVNHGTRQPSMIGVGELDGDAEPEILIADDLQLLALEHDLSLKWTWSTAPSSAWYPFTLADLDGDGLHEVIYQSGDALNILSNSGALLATASTGGQNASSWQNPPVVADLDGDGLAEIATAGSMLKILENPDGGWSIPGAEYPSPGLNRHPDDRDALGNVTVPADFWATPGHNVWQGLPNCP